MSFSDKYKVKIKIWVVLFMLLVNDHNSCKYLPYLEIDDNDLKMFAFQYPVSSVSPISLAALLGLIRSENSWAYPLVLAELAAILLGNPAKRSESYPLVPAELHALLIVNPAEHPRSYSLVLAKLPALLIVSLAERSGPFPHVPSELPVLLRESPSIASTMSLISLHPSSISLRFSSLTSLAKSTRRLVS